ncbi:MAG: hypothetical protein QM598_05855 [Protaetiibacter sp.]
MIATTLIELVQSVPTGIIDTANEQNAQVRTAVLNIGTTIVLIIALVAAIRAKLAIGAILGMLLGAGLVLWLINGGAAWIGAQLGSQFGS